ncbi:hypothetical protein QL093DRAFT_2074606 [Fusarium oxysporum]|nr:hypothetical protein QL093DRAFT_2074606 [Fusarium oxysporum]
MRSTCPYRTAPGTGYDSVEAVLFRDRGIVNYPETVVHRDDAIIPVAVIIPFSYIWVYISFGRFFPQNFTRLGAGTHNTAITSSNKQKYQKEDTLKHRVNA